MQKPVKYPVGVQDFSEVIGGGYVYVDKTALMRRLIDTGKYFFLSRPRRFGKSLLLSAFAAYFGGEKNLFKGLDIAEHTAEWPKHPVLRLDLGGQEYTDAESLNVVLNNRLNAWEELYGKRESEIGAPLRFGGVIRRACERTGRQAVILVDEYDKPLLEAADNEALQEKYRSTLRAFYFNLKSCDRYIKFAFLTGVTNFSKQLGVFNDLNNLSDISMREEYATICGITEAELDRYFGPGMEELARQHGMSPVEARAHFKKRYDGYLFCKNASKVYNTFSLLNTFSRMDFCDCWFESGSPDVLAKLMKRSDFQLENLPDTPVSAARLNGLDSLYGDLLPIMYQSGYLTLGDWDDMDNYYLRFPNEEVERGFLQELAPLYAAKDKIAANALLYRIVAAFDQGRPEDLMRELQALFADIPYEQGTPVEAYFRNLMFLVFRLVGFHCEVEHALASGRSDVVVKTERFIYVLEIKVNRSADAALEQIREKGYAEPYAADPRALFLIGVNFSTRTKRIAKWLVREGAG